MSDLLTTLTVTAVVPFLFQGAANNDQTDKLSQVKKPEVVAVQKSEPSKKEVKKTPKPKTYTVKEGDNLSAIADKHQTSWVRIWQKNKHLKHQDELKVGDKLTIPRKDEKLKERKIVVPEVAPTPSTSTPNVQSKKEAPVYQAPVAVNRPVVGEPNGYGYGWCTWWVKEKRPEIGGYWGNAGYNWISSAQAAGFSTGSAPRAGAIGVMPGHVVYVESVSGSTVNISEMGWGYQANSTANYRSVPASTFTYIY